MIILISQFTYGNIRFIRYVFVIDSIILGIVRGQRILYWSMFRIVLKVMV